VRDIIWGACEIHTDTYEDDTRRAEILNFDKNTTHLTKGIITHNNKIVRPLEFKARPESLEGVNES
jgi:hypothetical protein